MPGLGRVGRQRRCQRIKVGCSSGESRQAHNGKRRSEARPIAAHMQSQPVRGRHEDARGAPGHVVGLLIDHALDRLLDRTEPRLSGAAQCGDALRDLHKAARMLLAGIATQMRALVSRFRSSHAPRH